MMPLPIMTIASPVNVIASARTAPVGAILDVLGEVAITFSSWTSSPAENNRLSPTYQADALLRCKRFKSRQQHSLDASCQVLRAVFII